MLLAAIGEQLSDSMAEGDEVGGLSVSIRDRENIIQIWNKDSTVAEKATVTERVKQLLPDVVFAAIFYKGICVCQQKTVVFLLKIIVISLTVGLKALFNSS